MICSHVGLIIFLDLLINAPPQGAQEFSRKLPFCETPALSHGVPWASMGRAARDLCGQTACKPGSVPDRCTIGGAAIHLGRQLPMRLMRPTRAAGQETHRRTAWTADAAPIWSCSRWGLPCRVHVTRRRGALLPHPFTLARPGIRRRFVFCGTFPGVAPAGCYPAPCLPWSPDFPPLPCGQGRPSGRLTMIQTIGRNRGRRNRCGGKCPMPSQTVVRSGLAHLPFRQFRPPQHDDRDANDGQRPTDH